MSNVDFRLYGSSAVVSILAQPCFDYPHELTLCALHANTRALFAHLTIPASILRRDGWFGPEDTTGDGWLAHTVLIKNYGPTSQVLPQLLDLGVVSHTVSTFAVDNMGSYVHAAKLTGY